MMIISDTKLPHLNFEVEEGLTVRDCLIMDLESTLFKIGLMKGTPIEEIKKQNTKL